MLTAKVKATRKKWAWAEVKKDFPKAVSVAASDEDFGYLCIRSSDEDDEFVGLPFEGADNLRNCCGVRLLSGFERTITKLERAAFFLALHNPKYRLNEMAFMATTANQSSVDALLSFAGFEMVHSGRNPKSGNLIRIWLYKSPPQRKKRR